MKDLIIAFFLLFSSFLGMTVTGNAQVREVPSAVEHAFESQYPDAPSADFEDRLVEVMVYFHPGNQSDYADSLHTAKYSSKGIWKFTRVPIPFEDLPQPVKEGLNKSKYKNWQVDHTFKVSLPAHQVRYKVQVEKGVLRKKNLYFKENGQLLRDNITLY